MRRDLFTSPVLRQGASGNLAVKEPVTADKLWPSLSGPMDRHQAKVSPRPVSHSPPWEDKSVSVPSLKDCFPMISTARGCCYRGPVF